MRVVLVTMILLISLTVAQDGYARQRVSIIPLNPSVPLNRCRPIEQETPKNPAQPTEAGDLAKIMNHCLNAAKCLPAYMRDLLISIKNSKKEVCDASYDMEVTKNLLKISERWLQLTLDDYRTPKQIISSSVCSTFLHESLHVGCGPKITADNASIGLDIRRVESWAQFFMNLCSCRPYSQLLATRAFPETKDICSKIKFHPLAFGRTWYPENIFELDSNKCPRQFQADACPKLNRDTW